MTNIFPPPAGEEMICQDELKRGTRFRLSPLGLQRCPKLAASTGMVLEVMRTKSPLRVKFDGTKSIRSFHRTYIMPIPET
jgi:hypothetical protein